MHLKGMLPVHDPLHRRDRRRMAVNNQLILPAGAPQDRMLMPRIGGDAFSGGDLQNRQPHGHKQLRLVALEQLLIDIGQSHRRRFTALNTVAQQNARDHHEQRRRHTLSGHIRHHQADVIVVEQEEIVEIAADLLRRIHGGVNIKFIAVREGREQMRQLAGLNGLRHAKLGTDPLLLRRHLADLLHIPHRLFRQRCEGLRQHLDLVAGPVSVLHHKLQIPALQRSDPAGDRIERHDDPLRQNQRRGDPAHKNERQQNKHGHLRSCRTLPEGRDRFPVDRIILLLHLVDRLPGQLPLHDRDHTPSHSRQRRTRHIIDRIAHLHLTHPGLAGQRIGHKLCQLLLL